MNNNSNRFDSTDSELREAATVLNDAAVKERMAEQIVANSTEYTSTDKVVEDFPTTKSLATKLNQVAPGVATQTEDGENVTNMDDADDLKMFGSDA